ncbi:MAG TPA: flagellar protein FlaG [Acidobacteriota bacterium]|nr:flagellar protein FlaG [Acidobacteriota bacterium]
MKSELIAFEPHVEKLSNQALTTNRPPVDPRSSDRVKEETDQLRTQVPEEPVEKKIEIIRAPVLSFRVDEDSGRTFIVVTDPVSGETIRQVPPEEVRRLSSLFDRLRGNAVDMLA